MKKTLVELYFKKHRYENKINQMLDEARWRWVWILFWILHVFLIISINLLTFCYRGGIKFSKTMLIIYTVVFMINYIFNAYRLLKIIFALYYRLPRYRRKVAEIDHQIIEILAKSNF